MGDSHRKMSLEGNEIKGKHENISTAFFREYWHVSDLIKWWPLVTQTDTQQVSGAHVPHGFSELDSDDMTGALSSWLHAVLCFLYWHDFEMLN